MSNNTGGPAFPYTEANGANSGGVGMTLRDYFATTASEDDIAAHSLKGFKEEYVFKLGNGQREILTREARWTREQSKYRYADAMLKEREA